MNTNEPKDNRNLAPKRLRANTAKPARQREGQTYAGGRTLRRALKNLYRRQKSVPTGAGYKFPGSMRK